MARYARYGVHLVHHHRVGDVARDPSQILRNGLGDKGCDVAGMAGCAGTQVGEHLFVDAVRPGRDGTQHAPARHDKIEGGQVDPGLLQGLEYRALAEIELVEDVRKGSELFGRVADILFKRQGKVFEYPDFGRSRTGVDHQASVFLQGFCD